MLSWVSTFIFTFFNYRNYCKFSSPCTFLNSSLHSFSVSRVNNPIKATFFVWVTVFWQKSHLGGHSTRWCVCYLTPRVSPRHREGWSDETHVHYCQSGITFRAPGLNSIDLSRKIYFFFPFSFYLFFLSYVIWKGIRNYEIEKKKKRKKLKGRKEVKEEIAWFTVRDSVWKTTKLGKYLPGKEFLFFDC